MSGDETRIISSLLRDLINVAPAAKTLRSILLLDLAMLLLLPLLQPLAVALTVVPSCLSLLLLE